MIMSRPIPVVYHYYNILYPTQNEPLRFAHINGVPTNPILSTFTHSSPNDLLQVSRWFDGMCNYTVMRKAGYSTGDYSSEALARFETAKSWINGSNAIVKVSIFNNVHQYTT